MAWWKHNELWTQRQFWLLSLPKSSKRSSLTMDKFMNSALKDFEAIKLENVVCCKLYVTVRVKCLKMLTVGISVHISLSLPLLLSPQWQESVSIYMVFMNMHSVSGIDRLPESMLDTKWSCNSRSSTFLDIRPRLKSALCPWESRHIHSNKE